MTTKRVIEHWASANRELLACPDFTKCGSCWKEKIRSDVAKEFLQAGKTDQKYLSDLMNEVDNRWLQTDLYKQVRAMQDAGQSLDEIEEIMSQKGIQI